MLRSQHAMPFSRIILFSVRICKNKGKFHLKFHDQYELFKAANIFFPNIQFTLYKKRGRDMADYLLCTFYAALRGISRNLLLHAPRYHLSKYR